MHELIPHFRPQAVVILHHSRDTHCVAEAPKKNMRCSNEASVYAQ